MSTPKEGGDIVLLQCKFILMTQNFNTLNLNDTANLDFSNLTALTEKAMDYIVNKAFTKFEKEYFSKNIEAEDFRKSTEIEITESEINNVLGQKLCSRISKRLLHYNALYFKGNQFMQINAISGISSGEKINISVNNLFIKAMLEKKRFSYICINSEQFMSLKNTYENNLLLFLLKRANNALHSENYNSGSINFSTTPNELRSELLIADSLYKRYGDFKKRILVPAINSINELGYNVDFTEITEGKKVVGLEFKMI